jgi:NADH-quinone oxidoreductase subunit E
MSVPYDEIRELAAPYPDPRSAILPALRLAQQRHGWLPPEALREVADALDLSPAYCESIASFYEQFHLEPVGRTLIEVCTNLPCAVVGAQRVIEAFEAECGLEAGETSDDGAFTLRPIECLGGCGFGTVVMIDNRYRERVQPEDVPALVQELRARQADDGHA